MAEAAGEEAASSVLLEPSAVVKADIARLATDLRTIVNNPEYSDVSFRCKDGVILHAPRIVLIARSPVFKGMLCNGMLETKLAEIPFPEFSSQALLPVLEYLCTGEVVATKLTVVSAFEVILASRFLLVRGLEEYVFKLLQPALSKLDGGSNPVLLAWCFSRIAEISPDVKRVPSATPHEDSLAQVVRNLARLMRAEFLLRSPSDICRSLDLNALNVFLEFTGSKNKRVISMVEYLRLRSTLLWAASKVSVAKEEYLRKVLLDDLQLVDRFEGLVLSPSENATTLDSEELLAQLNHKTWSALQINCIHPELLIKVLEPLHVIPSSTFMEALRFQALHAREGNHTMKWDPNGCSNGYEFLDGGLVVRARADAVGIVRSTMPLNKLRGICEWEVFVEELPARLYSDRAMMQIGIAEAPPLFPLGDYCEPSTWQVWNNGRAGDYYHGRQYCSPFGQGSTVTLRVDMEARTCAFSVRGEAFGVAFDKLPRELSPCIQMTAGCKARIRLVSDDRFM